MSSVTDQLKYETKSYWGNRSRVRNRFVAIFFIVSSVGCFTPARLHAAAQPTPDSSIGEVTVEQG